MVGNLWGNYGGKWWGSGIVVKNVVEIFMEMMVEIFMKNFVEIV
jgi:hypothetical protein